LSYYQETKINLRMQERLLEKKLYLRRFEKIFGKTPFFERDKRMEAEEAAEKKKKEKKLLRRKRRKANKIFRNRKSEIKK